MPQQLLDARHEVVLGGAGSVVGNQHLHLLAQTFADRVRIGRNTNAADLRIAEGERFAVERFARVVRVVDMRNIGRQDLDIGLIDPKACNRGVECACQ